MRYHYLSVKEMIMKIYKAIEYQYRNTTCSNKYNLNRNLYSCRKRLY